jgi:hypothetical protein
MVLTWYTTGSPPISDLATNNQTLHSLIVCKQHCAHLSLKAPTLLPPKLCWLVFQPRWFSATSPKSRCIAL